MQLKVIKKFNGKDEGRILNPNDVITSTDIDRINALVGGGYCEISSLEDAPIDNSGNSVVEFQGREYGLDEIKAALSVIGTPVAANAGIKGVTNALDKLSEEHITALLEELEKEG